MLRNSKDQAGAESEPASGLVVESEPVSGLVVESDAASGWVSV